jgi:hypothetical protein
MGAVQGIFCSTYSCLRCYKAAPRLAAEGFECIAGVDAGVHSHMLVDAQPVTKCLDYHKVQSCKGPGRKGKCRTAADVLCNA